MIQCWLLSCKKLLGKYSHYTSLTVRNLPRTKNVTVTEYCIVQTKLTVVVLDVTFA